MSKFSKAIWAFLSTSLGSTTVAVAATAHHSLRDIGTLGWLGIMGSVLLTVGGVYGFSNKNS